MRAISLLLVVAVAAGEAMAADDDAFRRDLQARRARLMERLGSDTLFAVWSPPTRVYSRDVDYEYRQDSNLLYLTGIDQRDTTLALMPDNDGDKKEILFVRRPDAKKEHREGHILTKAEAQDVSGISTVYYVDQFENFVNSLLSGKPYGTRRRDPRHGFDTFFKAVKQGRARLALVLSPKPGLSDPLGPAHLFAGRVRERHFDVTIRDAAGDVDALRQLKTAFEQGVLGKSVAISAEAHRAGMRAARPGGYEYEVEAAIEQVYLVNGAMSPGYPSIVASGPNATILHYSASSRRMEDGDLLLVDAAGNYRGLTGDITRTYPVNGRFTERQKEIYRLALAAQEAGMRAARVGAKTADIEKASEDVVSAGLLKLGLITDASGDQFRTFYTHGICHWIGMDVHDVGDYERPLEPGMTFVIEPGIYVREVALDQLPDTSENRAFAAKVRPTVRKYKDIGVRVEDSFLLTEKGLKNLSADVPRTIADVEAFMAGSR